MPQARIVSTSVPELRSGVNFSRIVNVLSRPPSRKTADRLATSISATLVIALTVTVIVSYLRSGDWGVARLMSTGADGSRSEPQNEDLLLTFPGVIRPPILSAGDIGWNDEDEVIGVTVDGRSRAYLVASLGRPARHIVNDMVGPVPVSVTYCNIDRCARAFTRAGGEGPLDLSIGGLSESTSLILLADGVRFRQKTLQPYARSGPQSAFPYQEVPVTVTTWKRWREAHPDTLASSDRVEMQPPPGMGPGGPGTSKAERGLRAEGGGKTPRRGNLDSTRTVGP
jgi:hypothetical protein